MSSAVAGPSKQPIKRTAFELQSSIDPFYTGAGPSCITSDGRYLFTAIDEEVLCTDLTVGTGQVIARWSPDDEDVSSISITKSASHLCVTTRAASCTLFTYAITSMSPFQTRRLHTQARAHESPVAISAIDSTETLLATGAADGVVKVWDIAGGFVTHALRGHGGIVSAIAFDLDVGSQTHRRSNLATSSVDGRVRVWDLNNRPKQGAHKPAATLGGHVSVVRGLDVGANGTRMISGARDKTVCLWEAKTIKKKGEKMVEWGLKATISAGEGVEACGFLDEEGERFFTGGTSSELRIWSFSTGGVEALQPRGKWAKQSYNEKEDSEEGEEDGLQGIVGVHYLADASTLLSLHADSRLIFRSTAKTTGLLSRLRQIVGFNDEAVDLSIMGDNGTHIAVATNSSAIRVYPLPTLKAAGQDDEMEDTEDASGSVHLLPPETSEPGHSDTVLCIDASPLGDLLVSGSKDRTARVWAFSTELQEWRCVAVAEGHAESVGAVCFSKKTKWETFGANFLVTASQDRTVKIWDMSTLTQDVIQGSASSPLRLKSLVTLKVHEKAINAIQLAPNDTLLVTGSQDRTAKLFSLSFTPPSKTNGQLQATARLTPLATLKGHKRGVWSVGFSPVDAALYTTSGDRTAKLWSIKDFTCVKTFEGHSHSILSASFLAGSRGTQLLTAGADGLIKVWSVRDEECTTTLEGSEDRLWAVGSFAEGTGIVTVGADGSIRFHRDVTQEKEAAAFQEKEQGIQREQQYENLLAVEDYTRAILLCLSENQPRRLLGLLTTVASRRPVVETSLDSMARLLDLALKDGQDGIAKTDPAVDPSTLADAESITGLSSVDTALALLPLPHLRQLLTYVRTWNASSRTSPLAQNTLHCILRSYTSRQILDAFESSVAIDSSPADGKGNKKKPAAPLTLPQLLEALLPYSQRHYARAERTLVESSILGYTVQLMGSGVVEEDEQRSGEDLESSDDEDEEDSSEGDVDMVNGLSESDDDEDEEMA